MIKEANHTKSCVLDDTMMGSLLPTHSYPSLTSSNDKTHGANLMNDDVSILKSIQVSLLSHNTHTNVSS